MLHMQLPSARKLPPEPEDVEISRPVGNAGASMSLNSFGLVRHALRAYSEALAYHARSLALRETIGDRTGVAASLNNIGLVHSRLGAYNDALEYFNTNFLSQINSLGIEKVLEEQLDGDSDATI